MTLEQLYAEHCGRNTAIAPHLPRLRALATGCELAVEFGVKKGASTTALLLGAAKVFSVDLVETKQARALQQIAGARWTYQIADSRQIEIPEPDLILFDSLHTFAQVASELAAHGMKARRYLVFHDVTTFGEIGALDETGRQSWTYVPGKGSCPFEYLGIRPAIDLFQCEHPEWRTYMRYFDSHGLLVLRRD